MAPIYRARFQLEIQMKFMLKFTYQLEINMYVGELVRNLDLGEMKLRFRWKMKSRFK